MMIKTKAQILNEGRYDSLTRVISKDIMKYVKETEGHLQDIQRIELPYDKNGEEKYGHESGLSIEVDLIISRTVDTILYGNRELPYYINTYVAADNVLVMEITIDETYGREFYEEISYKINEDTRHEIEHYLQNIFSDRQKPLIPNTSEYETVFAHHIDPSEVEALVRGFNRRAKLEKKPLDVIMLDDLNKEIIDGNLTNEESNILLQTWITYAIKNLPRAQISIPTRRRVSFKK